MSTTGEGGESDKDRGGEEKENRNTQLHEKRLQKVDERRRGGAHANSPPRGVSAMGWDGKNGAAKFTIEKNIGARKRRENWDLKRIRKDSVKGTIIRGKERKEGHGGKGSNQDLQFLQKKKGQIKRKVSIEEEK